MTRHVRLVKADPPIRETAMIMAEIDARVVLVGEDYRLVGMLTA